jgi:hypothetical protein
VITLINMTPPEKLDAQTVDNQHWMPFQFLGSLHPVGRGWGANQSPEPTWMGAAVLPKAVGIYHAVVPTRLSFGR